MCDRFDVTCPDVIETRRLVHMAALWYCLWYESRKCKGDVTSNGNVFVPYFMKFVSFFKSW